MNFKGERGLESCGRFTIIDPKQETWKCKVLLYDFGSVDKSTQHNAA